MPETYTLAEATMKVIQDRRSIREWTDEPISEQDLAMILEAGRQAPSARERAALALYHRAGCWDAQKAGRAGGRRKRTPLYR